MTTIRPSQPDLFGAAVRNTDPVTSVEAAASLPPNVLSAQRRQVLAGVAHVDRYDHRGATACDVVKVLSVIAGRAPQQSVVARRLTDLRELGFVEDSGRTRPGFSGRHLIEWSLTSAGREAAG